MAPIRVAIIGLNAGSSWAVNAHLPYLRISSKYTITGLLNSTVDKARASIKSHSLPDTTTAYSSPETLAQDPNIDLVVCAVRVDHHYATLLPSANAGKNIFCEWPLGRNLQEAEELLKAAKESGSKLMIGFQGAAAPVVLKMKQIIDEGTIGKVLSSSVLGAAYNGGPEEWEGVEYIAGRETGGNVLTIHFMHSIVSILQVLGELATFTSTIETTRPTVNLVSGPLTDPTRKLVRTITRTSPDQFLVQGHFTSGALLSYHLRGGKPFAPDEGLVWRIHGEKGELQLRAGGAALQIGYENEKLELKVGDEAPVVVEVEDEWKEKLPQATRNVARLYEAYADGKTEVYWDWDVAVSRHRLVEELYAREKEGGQESEARYSK